MDAISLDEKQEFREILQVIFGPQVRNWDINIRVLELFGTLIQTSDSCSRYMDLVPRPFVVGSVIKWVSKQAREYIVRHIKNSGKHYLVCLRVAGLSMKNDFYMASQGF